MSDDSRKGLLKFVACYIVICLMVAAIALAHKYAARAAWQDALESGYTFYLDGQEVDPELVDRSKCRIYYDDDIHEVHMYSLEDVQPKMILAP